MADRQTWVQRIRADLKRGVLGILEAGEHLAIAKAELGLMTVPPPIDGMDIPKGMTVYRDSWVRFVTDCGISESTASKLMRIARNQILTDEKYTDILPLSWTTLYQLSQENDDTLREWLDSGKISRGTMAADITILKSTRKPRGLRPRPPGPSKKELTEKVRHLESERDRAAESGVDVLLFNDPETIASHLVRQAGEDEITRLVELLSEWLGTPAGDRDAVFSKWKISQCALAA